MRAQEPPIAMDGSDAPARTKPSNYPEPFALRMEGQVKRPLGNVFGLTNFGVNFKPPMLPDQNRLMPTFGLFLEASRKQPS